jgi:hypothetical protein
VKITLQFGRDRLWPIHQFQLGRIELSLHADYCSGGL